MILRILSNCFLKAILGNIEYLEISLPSSKKEAKDRRSQDFLRNSSYLTMSIKELVC